MKRTRFTEEQIIAILREQASKKRSAGVPYVEVGLRKADGGEQRQRRGILVAVAEEDSARLVGRLDSILVVAARMIGVDPAGAE